MTLARIPKFFGDAAPALLLGLAAQFLLPQAARAQSLTLNSGDAITVSGLGTAGHIGATVYTRPNAMTTITASGGYAVETNDTAAFTLAAGGSLTCSVSGGQGLLDDKGSGPLTVTGGAITESGLSGYGLYDAGGSGPITITGGTITASGQGGSGLYINSGDSSPVTISGGILTASGLDGIGLVGFGSGPVDISGGTFTGGQGGGAFGLDAGGSGLMDITGGTFSAGQGGFGLVSQGSGVIDLFGTGFSYTVNGMTTQIASGDLPTSGVFGTLDGTLLDGQALNATRFLNFATIEVNIGTPPAAVPEASTTVSFGLLLALGLGGVVIAAKKKKAVTAA